MFGLFETKKKKVFILLGQEDKEGTLCDFLADTYEQAAKDAGHEVRRMNIGDMKFDPLLHKGYKAIQELEPDLKLAQENIKWCEHFVLFYPTWWSAMPAILKGLFDRMWLPGFAFHFNPHHLGWHGLLHGRSARVIITMQNWPLVSLFLFGDSKNEIGRAILWFAGFRPVKVMQAGHLENISDSHKESLRRMAHKLGTKAK